MIITTLSVHGQWRLVYVWIMSGPLGEPWIGLESPLMLVLIEMVCIT